MIDNVVPLPGALDRLAVMIQSAIERRDYGRDEWIEGTILMCQCLAEARDAFKDNTEFGNWCEVNGFGPAVLTHQDRAAAIKMGRDINKTRGILETTERSSLRLICSEEFDLTNAGKTTSDDPTPTEEPTVNAPEAAPQAAAPEPKKEKPVKPPREERIGGKEEHALAVYDRLSAAGKKVTRNSLAREADVSFGTAQRAINRRASEERAAAAAAAPVKASKTQEEMIEREVRRRVQEARVIFEKEIKDDLNKRMHEDVLPTIQRKEEWARRILDAQKGVFTKQVYKKIQMCLHPDTTPTIERKTEAFRLFIEKEDVLVKPDTPVSQSSLPRSVDELMAMRRAKEERAKKK